MQNNKEIITIEYNPLAGDEDIKQFHVDTMERILEKNNRNCLERKCLHWVLIGMAESTEQAFEFIEEFKIKLSQR